MKNYFIIFFIMFCFSVCGQKTITSNMIYIPENCKNINASNIVSNITKRVRRYNKETKYFIRPVQNNCVFEVLVNDFPVYQDYSLEVIATPIEINSGILKSGPQTVTVRMYPIGDLLKDEYDMGNTVTTLLDNTSMKVEVVKYEAYNINRKLSDEETVLTHYSPKKPNSKNFIGAGLPYYEYTFSFNAEVPYSYEGWSEGEDLTQFDKKDLQKELIRYYKELKREFSNKDLVSKVFYEDMLRNSQVTYRSEREIKDAWSEFDESIKIDNKVFFELEECDLEFFGNKKIVVLKHSSKTPIDIRLQGKSGFGYKYEEDESILAEWFDVYLYIPKGGTLADLQTIK